jgi:CHAT domain
MAANILLVSDNPEESALLEEDLTMAGDVDGEPLAVLSVNSEQGAKRALPGDFRLVITPLRIRRTPTSPVNDNEQRGLELLKWMGSNQMRIPSLLVASSYPGELSDTEGIHFVRSGGDMIQEIAKRSRNLVSQRPCKCLNVEIRVTDATHWTFKLSGRGFLHESEHDLVLDERTMNDVIDYANDLSVPGFPNWKKSLHNTGEKLLRALWSNQELSSNLLQAVMKAGGEEHARVRFTVTPGVHEMALEAILSPESQEKHWMLQAPVYRRLLSQPPSGGGTLFEGGERIQCLIIEAPVSGLVQNPDIVLAELTSISEECRALHDLLKQKQEAFNLAEPVYLRPEPGQPSMAKRVQELLESRDWGIVHYAGHSHYDADTKSGCLFLPGDAGAGVDTVEITKLSGWLRRAKFVYLSSCDSGAGRFMFALASRNVSNLIGFRWPIDDGFAAEYAKVFYETLFAKRSFEQAFLRGRKEMYYEHPNDLIWAAPLLIMQLNES